jgi:hypothetical protein
MKQKGKGGWEEVAKEKENLINLPDFLCLPSDASWLTKNREESR